MEAHLTTVNQSELRNLTFFVSLFVEKIIFLQYDIIKVTLGAENGKKNANGGKNIELFF